MTPKAKWEDVREVIEKETGPIRSVQQISEGYNSEVSVIVYADDGATFVKGRQTGHPRVWTQKIEREINPAVQPVSARIKWSVQSDAWDLNGFDYLPGRKADYSPGSADLPKVVDVLRQVQEIPCPAVEVKQAEHRWRHYTDRPDQLAGAGLLHTEWTPGNVLIGECAHLVDWAWATKGAPWIDPACWVVWLIAAGHAPGSAEAWAARIASWRDAPASSLDEFARIQALMWAEIAQESSERWTSTVAAASAQWCGHRRVSVLARD